MDNEQKKTLDLDVVRDRLQGPRGQGYWRSLEEVAQTEEFQRWVEDEFPERASLFQVDRRKFLHLMGASLALAGLAGCRSMPQDRIVPYVKQPEEIVPGKALLFATALTLGGYARGVLVESHEGRPTKVEGNPGHPASLGRADAFMQAEVLNLYDPDRSQVVRSRGEISSWDAFLLSAREMLQRQAATGGAGLRILTETVTSPTLAAQIRALLTRFPAARWHQYEPAARDHVTAGARQAFGEPVNTLYRFDGARVILSLDADFLLTMPGHLRYAREFINGRQVRANRTTMNRLYVAESSPTITGAMADHRLPVRASDIEAFARAVAAELGVGEAAAAPAGVPTEWIPALARDLRANRGASIVVAGDHQSPTVHALAHAMNAALGNSGRTVIHTAPVEAEPTDQNASLRNLAADMNAGRVEMLLILGGNPVYTAPADLRFAEALAGRNGQGGVPFRAHLGLYEDETSALCQWHLPETHTLEMWGDARAYDGTVSIIQPLIAPLYDNRSAIEVLAGLLAQPRQGGYEIVREYWRGQRAGADFEVFWERTLNEGYMRASSLTPRTVAVRPDWDAAATPPAEGLEIVFRPDPSIWDGRYANNSWLQELPKPLTKLTWDNAVLMSPDTAERLGLSVEDRVELRYQGRTLQAAIWTQPGHANDSATLHLGYGRTLAGNVGNRFGFNANAIRTSENPWIARGVEIVKIGGTYPFACTQYHHTMPQAGGSGDMHGRDIIRVATLQTFRQKGGHIGPEDGPDTPGERRAREATQPGATEVQAERGEVTHREQEPTPSVPADPRGIWRYKRDSHEPGEAHPSIFPEYDYSDNYAWGMAIDQNACIGCNACVIACQSENNIPTVGKEQVQRGREMHWLRIDRYHKGGYDNPETYFQPMLCVHCEKAPCEPVCPVAATVHSHEGLNMMVYNRCIGTRYCSNNCPYKVRRFNFLKWTAGKGGPTTTNFDLPVLKMVNNPDVTVRGRGVMEKCTFCVQRINRHRIEAKKEQRPIRDGEFTTACAQTCPTDAIIFGDINDRDSRVARLKREPHNYSVLGELNTQPRTTYLARLRNPNPEIPTESEVHAGGGQTSGH